MRTQKRSQQDWNRKATFAAVASMASLALLFLAAGCALPNAGAGSLAVPGYSRDSSETAESLLATIQLSPEIPAQNGERATQVGTTSYADLVLSNSGQGKLSIDGVEIYALNSAGELVLSPQAVFGFAGGIPDFPLSMDAGSVYSFPLSFSPITAGEQKASILFKTSAGDRLVRLVGRGAWLLTLEVPFDNDGRIIRPIVVESDETKTYLGVEADIELECETTHPEGLSELQNWSVISGAATFGGFSTNPNLIATVSLTGAATVRATFWRPYVFVSSNGNDTWTGENPTNAVAGTGPVATIARGITQFYALPSRKGMAFSQGSFTMGENDNLPRGLIRGGYATDFNTRPSTYAPNVAAGTAGTTASVIDSSSWHLIMDGSSLNPATLLEGFSISAGPNTAIAGLTEDRLSVGIAVINGASPTIRNCYFSGGADSRNSVGAYIYKASPSFTNCVITGKTVSEQGGRSVGLWCNTESRPSFEACLIRGGTANVTYGKSYGILNVNFDASPTVRNSVIDAGSASSASYGLWSSYGGQPKFWNNQVFTQNAAAENYGIYLGSNGRIYVLSGNNIYNCNTGLAYFSYNDTTYEDIDSVNEQWVQGWPESYGYTENTSVAP